MDNIISAAFGLIVILIVLIILGSCIKVVPQSRAFVVERFCPRRDNRSLLIII